jgi:hypothetical protein
MTPTAARVLTCNGGDAAYRATKPALTLQLTRAVSWARKRRSQFHALHSLGRPEQRGNVPR